MIKKHSASAYASPADTHLPPGCECTVHIRRCPRKHGLAQGIFRPRGYGIDRNRLRHTDRNALEDRKLAPVKEVHENKTERGAVSPVTHSHPPLIDNASSNPRICRP